MAPSPLSLRILALPLSLTAAAFDPRNFTEDALLPGFHFVPWPFDWMNDPNGPMWDPVHERYHLMYQYQTPRNWGHAVSEDLVNWVQLPQALTRTESYDAGGDFSGSATILDDAAQTPVLTVSTNRNDMVFVALPADRDDPNLTNWTYPDYNPLFSTDARDPTEIFKTSGGACRVLPRRPMRWPLRAVLGGASAARRDDRDAATLRGFAYRAPAGAYRIADGTSEGTALWEAPTLDAVLSQEWSYVGVLDASAGEYWECPDFFPLLGDAAVDGAYVSKYSSGGDHFTTGTYDEDAGTFTPFDESFGLGQPAMYDTATCFYASKTFLDTPNARRVLWGWLVGPTGDANDWQSAQSAPRVVEAGADGRSVIT